MAHPVALDRLDLDDLGAEIAQHLGGERPLGELREIGDDESCQSGPLMVDAPSLSASIR